MPGTLGSDTFKGAMPRLPIACVAVRLYPYMAGLNYRFSDTFARWRAQRVQIRRRPAKRSPPAARPVPTSDRSPTGETPSKGRLRVRTPPVGVEPGPLHGRRRRAFTPSAPAALRVISRTGTGVFGSSAAMRAKYAVTSVPMRGRDRACK